MDQAIGHDAELSAAIEACALAGRVCRLIQTTGDGPQRIIKADQSPVTIGDFSAQAVAAKVLHERLGPIRLVGEESSAFLRSDEGRAYRAPALEALKRSGAWADVSERELIDAIDLGHGPPSERFWTIDPIDGTKGFLRGQQYCVCLALIERGQPVVGVLCCPNLSADFSHPFDERDPHGVLLFARAGKGVWSVPADDHTRRATRVQRATWASDHAPGITESVSVGHSNRTAFAAVCAGLKPPGASVQLDSQCKYAVVARGQADAYLRVPPRGGYRENIWDHAPGVLMVREAGCIATDALGRELDFSQAKMSGGLGVVAAPPELHARMIAITRTLDLGPGT
jgi:3'(2'), 5'-bisphosphate nucleotidase